MFVNIRNVDNVQYGKILNGTVCLLTSIGSQFARRLFRCYSNIQRERETDYHIIHVLCRKIFLHYGSQCPVGECEIVEIVDVSVCV